MVSWEEMVSETFQEKKSKNGTIKISQNHGVVDSAFLCNFIVYKENVMNWRVVVG